MSNREKHQVISTKLIEHSKTLPCSSPDERALVLDFGSFGIEDTALVGGKNASLGELFRTLRPLGVRAVDGFATTTTAFREFLAPSVQGEVSVALASIVPGDLESLTQAGQHARKAVLGAELGTDFEEAIEAAYQRLCTRCGYEPALAVRSSATCEDLPNASFAGQHETFLNVRGVRHLQEAIRRCFASLFTDRAIDYRIRNGFDHLKAYLSVGVQPMVRSDIASSGVIFTLEPESGFRNAVFISGSYGLGETIVQGNVAPDEWTVFKPTLRSGHMPILSRTLGSKEMKLTLCGEPNGTELSSTSPAEREHFCLMDAEVKTLAKWACQIEDHYSEIRGRPLPMDIEWAKDGLSGDLFILQARPETVHFGHDNSTAAIFSLTERPPEPRVTGEAVGQRIASGKVRIVLSAEDMKLVQPGDVLVTSSTDPAWEPVMKRAAALVTDRGGRTSRAAIVSREIGIPCLVGTVDATTRLSTGEEVTVSCGEGSIGHVYPGKVAFVVQQVDRSQMPETKTKIMLNVADPEKAFALASLPNAGVGLARIEFIISDSIGIHSMAICRYPDLADPGAIEAIRKQVRREDPRDYFVRRLSEGIAQIAAAFFPKPVIVRFSDFKTNEYARLIGGREFEPAEENPMLGFRGAARYYDPRYAEGFRLECLAIQRTRSEMGLTNVKMMVPFCRTTAEARRVIEVMAGNGLVQGEDGLEVYGMCELPSNALDADEFLEIFDGFSIGSNDLTQLTLGIDRDSGTISNLFDETDFAVKSLIVLAIQAARRQKKPIGICGQAPSDRPQFARWLVLQGIDSLSLNPDSVYRTIEIVAAAEKGLHSVDRKTRSG